MQFTIDLDTAGLSKKLNRLAEGMAGEGIAAAVAETLFNRNRRRHEQGLAPDGSAWKPLAPSTIGNAIWETQNKRYRSGNTRRGAVHHLDTAMKVIRSRKILHSTGEMLLTNFHPSTAVEVSPTEIKIGFNIFYAQYHHFGTQPYTISPKKAKALAFGGVVRKRVHHPGLPARPLLGFPEDDRQAAVARIEEFIQVLLKATSGGA